MHRIATTVRQPPGPASRRRRSLLAAGLAALPAAWGTGCATARPLLLAGHPWPGYEPMFLARTLGYLPTGVELYESATVQESIDAARRGRVDGAMLTLEEVLQLRDQGIPYEIVLVFDVSRGADMLLGRPGLTRLDALRGQRVGVEDTALGSLMLTLALDKAGLRQEDISVRRIAYEGQERAWQRGEIDALVTYEPVGSRLMARGAHQLLSTRQLPDTIFDVLAMRRDTAQAHASTLSACLAGYFKALTYLRQNPWDAAYRVAPRLQLSAEGVISALRGLELPDLVGNQRYLTGEDSTLRQAAQRLSPLLQQAGLLQRPADPRQLITSSYLPQT